MDKRISKFMVFDTETANSIDCPLMYDFGYAIVDRRGNVYDSGSYAIKDIYCNEKDLLKTAYYAWKLPRYEDEISKREREIITLYQLKKLIAEKCLEYDVKALIAHNARFDYRSTATTQRYVTKSAYRYFLPYDIPLWDTLEMSKSVIQNKPTYQKYCKKNNYLTKRGKPRLTAEIIYRFISGENDFIEKHEGLADVLIEKEIFVYCMRQHKKMKKSPWRERV